MTLEKVHLCTMTNKENTSKTSPKTSRFAKKFILSIAILLTISFSAAYAYADAGEYNDYNLFSSSGTLYASGAFTSDNLNLTSFTLTVDAVSNEWGITDGSTYVIPFPGSIQINYSSTDDRAAFLTNSYVMVNNTRYNFSYIDNTGVFYCQNIPAGPYYPTVNVYLYTEETSPTTPPSSPTLSYSVDSDGYTYLNWNSYQNNHNYSAKVDYKENLTDTPTHLANAVYPPYKVEQTGYYTVALKYFDYNDNIEKITDWSQTIYVEYTEPDDSDDDNIIDRIDNIIDNLRESVNNVKNFVTDFTQIMADLISWLPSDVTTVFFSVVIIGFVIGLFL